ncbi:hypothetical protein Pst134EB_033251 [Puccinia striiformis f. sp. tritici]|nr:hypothetical protein Pst134EB_033251 [Puccinia striiformis f. sp. tritici]
MGCGPSKPAEDRDASHRSAAIDAQLRKDRSNARKEIKILLLGAGESGKSTLVKQMKCLWDQPYTQSERESYREVIFANTITSIQVVLDALPALQHITIPAEHGDAERIDLLLTLPPDSHDTPCLDPKVADAICQLWSRPGLKQAVALSHLYQLNDSASYYFDNIIRIAQPGYIPTEQDIVRSRVKSTGISESKFNVGQLIWKVFDVGGQRSERKKWIHCFENVNVLIFFVAINEYDQVLYEDECVNRMAEAATLFDSICNSQWFRQTQMILFFNKIDLFKAKLLTSPLSSRFPDYDGDNSYESAAKFIHRNFLQLCRDPNKDIITHFTCATDSQQISVVLAGVQESILRKNLAAAVSRCFTTHSLLHISCLLMRAPFSCKHTSRATFNYTFDRDDASPYARIYIYITQTNLKVFLSLRLSPKVTAPQKNYHDSAYLNTISTFTTSSIFWLHYDLPGFTPVIPRRTQF